MGGIATWILLATLGIQIRLWKHFFHPGSHERLHNLHSRRCSDADCIGPVQTGPVYCRDWTRQFQRSLPASIILQFCDCKVSHCLGASLHFNSRLNASAKAEWVFPAVRSLVNVLRNYQHTQCGQT